MEEVKRPRVTRDVPSRRLVGRMRKQRSTMSNRRKFIAGLGALATGSAAAIGTGAFTTVNAERSVSVSVAGDSSSYLSFTPQDSRADTSGGNGDVLSIDLSTSDNGSGGLNPDAQTEFLRLFDIRNQDDNPIYVTWKIRDQLTDQAGIVRAPPQDTNLDRVEANRGDTDAIEWGLDTGTNISDDTGEVPQNFDQPVIPSGAPNPLYVPLLKPGQRVFAGLRINTGPNPQDEFSVDSKILAVEPESSRDLRDTDDSLLD